MFGLFKKKFAPPTDVRSDFVHVNLFAIYEALNDDVLDLYSEFESYNPAELRFFTMSAISVLVQTLGSFPENEMRLAIDKFIEQCVGMMLYHMPKVEYSVLHNAFVNRFPVYPELIIDVLNAQTSDAMQKSSFDLVSTVDHYVGVERGGFDVSLAGLKLSAIITDLAINVRKVVRPA